MDAKSAKEEGVGNKDESDPESPFVAFAPVAVNFSG
jgi:hypothetical protein